METIQHDPDNGIYATTDDYVHAMEVRGSSRLLFVAGTMGLDAAGAAPATLEAQLDLVWRNIGTILGAAGMGFEDVVRVTTYLRDATHADRSGAARVAALGGRIVPTTAIEVRTLEDTWLVEVEVIAAA